MSADADGVERLVAAWGRIESWLRAHAPASGALLRPPAGEADIAAAEAAMGVELPATLAAWYRIHDGVDEDRAPSGAARIAGILPSGKTMLPLDRVVGEYQMRTREWERAAGIVPFARTPGDVWYGWYVDARKGGASYGNLGRWAVDEADEPYPWPSRGWPLPDWLVEIAAVLEQGRPMRRPDGTENVGDRPALYRGGLTWVDPRDLRIDAVVVDGPR
ncbi:SMI1/KNR4 family protein [Actinomadura atramentaria]|uniref:SMI1/KNR4 family protein n=1 Tax=Actinomadura atramentaria TaxID=1990 RepID=UPI00036064B6|nr:SMI1/KNR4 family protein [Actinomadura atramentaria]